MPNYWKIPGVPHKGWRLIDVEDIREDGQSEFDTDYECCMMCVTTKSGMFILCRMMSMEKSLGLGVIVQKK